MELLTREKFDAFCEIADSRTNVCMTESEGSIDDQDCFRTTLFDLISATIAKQEAALGQATSALDMVANWDENYEEQFDDAGALAKEALSEINKTLKTGAN